MMYSIDSGHPLTTIGWIAMRFGTDIQRMNSNDFGESHFCLNFPLAPRVLLVLLVVLSECLNSY